MLMSGKDLFIIYNHLENSSSTECYYVFNEVRLHEMFICCKRNGQVELLIKNSKNDKVKIYAGIKQLTKKNAKQNTDAEYDKVIEKLIYKYGGITFKKG